MFNTECMNGFIWGRCINHVLQLVLKVCWRFSVANAICRTEMQQSFWYDKKYNFIQACFVIWRVFMYII